MAKGYSIFVIKGQVPKVNLEINAIKKDPNWEKVPNPKRSVQSSNKSNTDQELEEALAASELELAIQESLKAQQSPNSATQKNSEEDEEDKELAQAIRLSQEVAPTKPTSIPFNEIELPKGADTTELSFRMPDGAKIDRRFAKTSKVQTLYDFLESRGISAAKYQIVSLHPRQVYSNMDYSLEQAGANGLLVVEQRKV